MSWDADLTGQIDGNPVNLFSQNYTHNCNVMANTALRAVAKRTGMPEPIESWWKLLHGMNGTDGYLFLLGIVTIMKTNPEPYIAMNPDNKWGSYETFLETLENMMEVSFKYPSAKWSTSG